MLVFIVRHGESENNQKGLWTGQYNAPLTERGRADAEGARAILERFSFDKVYSSDLDRAVETAKIALPGYSYETNKLLREIDLGTLANQPTSVLSGDEKAYAIQNGYSVYGGESRDEFKERIVSFKKELEGMTFQNVAVFCHGGWVKGFLNEVMGISIPAQKICCNNCTVAVFEYENSKWKLHSWMNLF